MPKISLSGAADLLTIIPFQLGFHPTRSVVVVCFHGSRLGMVARLDVPQGEHAPDAVQQAVAETASVLLRERPASVALVGFEEEPGEARPLTDAFSDAIEAERVIVRERLVVRGDRWFDLLRGCCPDHGHPMPDPSQVPAVASFVALGRAPLRGRDHLSRVFVPLAPTDPRHERLSVAVDQWRRQYLELGGESDALGLEDGALDDWEDAALDDWEDAALDGWEDAAIDDWEDAAIDDWEDDERLTARAELEQASLEAWAAVLRGDVDDVALEDRLPAIVGPLRDPFVRGLIVGWLRCDPAVLESWPRDPAEALPLLIHSLADATSAFDSVRAAARSSPSVSGLPGGPVHPGEPSDRGGTVRRPRRGRRKRGRRLGRVTSTSNRHEMRPGRPGAAGADDGLGWDDWGAAAAAPAIQSRLEAVCRLTPAAHAAPLLALVAAFAWWGGDGSRAVMAAEQALELEPDNALSRFIRDALACGLRAQAGVVDASGPVGYP